MLSLLKKRLLIPALGPLGDDLIAAQQFGRDSVEHAVPTIESAPNQRVMRPIFQLDGPAVWAVSDAHLTGIQGASVVPNADDKFKAELPDFIEKDSGFKAAVGEYSDPKAPTNILWNGLKQLQRERDRTGGVLALVDPGGDGKLDTAILGKEDDQVDAVNLVVDTYKGQHAALFLNARQINAQPQDRTTLTERSQSQKCPLCRLQ
ncbi:hypothetical protein GCM10022631_07800 [Deinococcus rubellus]